MPSISISQYWLQWLQRAVDSGIRKSKASLAEECFSRHRRHVEAEMEEFLQLKSEQKERREARQ